MKTRVVLSPNGNYKVEYKTFLFWHNHGTTEMTYDGGTYKITQWYQTESEATIAMIKIVQEYEIKMSKKRKAKIVKEFSSEELKEKFAEYWI